MIGVEHNETGEEGGGLVCLLPWKQRGSCRGVPSQSLWRQKQVPFGQGSHTCNPHSVSSSAEHRAGTPGNKQKKVEVCLMRG